MHPQHPDTAEDDLVVSSTGSAAPPEGADSVTDDRAGRGEAPESTDAPTGGGGALEAGSQPDITPLELPLEASLEAICMVVDDPVEPVVLAQVLGRPVDEVEGALRRLAEGYAEQGRGFELRQVPGGWRFYSRPEYAAAVERFILDGQQARLTQASLETLAVVAYRQPISRSRVSAVRGVNVDGVMRTLLSRGLVEEAGVEEGSGATLYRTSSYFLERLGLDDLTQLPDLAPLLPDVEFLESTDD
jgi:segregation and condensation protein B